MAEFIMKALVRAHGLEGEYHIESAAVSTEEIGNGIYPPARRCLSQHGVLFDSSKTARQVTPADYERFDRLICMDSSNLRWMRRIMEGKVSGTGKKAPSGSPSWDPDGKIHLMMSYTGSGRDVADPWYTGDFEETFSDVLAACEAMLRQDLALR